MIAGAYLAGTNTRRVRRALAALFAGAVSKAPVPGRVGIIIGDILRRVDQALLLALLLVGSIGLLIADIDAVAPLGVGIDIMDDVTIDALEQLLLRQAGEHRPLHGCGGGFHDESRGGEIAFLAADALGRDRRGGGSDDRENGESRRRAAQPHSTCEETLNGHG